MSMLTTTQSLPLYYQTVINRILLHQTQINTHIQQNTNQKNYIQNLKINDSIDLVLSSIENTTVTKCNFCNKTAYYYNNYNKLYCWFHRSQFE